MFIVLDFATRVCIMLNFLSPMNDGYMYIFSVTFNDHLGEGGFTFSFYARYIPYLYTIL